MTGAERAEHGPPEGGGGGDLPKHTRFQTDGSDNTAHGGKT